MVVITIRSACASIAMMRCKACSSFSSVSTWRTQIQYLGLVSFEEVARERQLARRVLVSNAVARLTDHLMRALRTQLWFWPLPAAGLINRPTLRAKRRFWQLAPHLVGIMHALADQAIAPFRLGRNAVRFQERTLLRSAELDASLCKSSVIDHIDPDQAGASWPPSRRIGNRTIRGASSSLAILQRQDQRARVR